MMRLGELVPNQQFTVYRGHFLALLYLSIVTAKVSWCTLMSDEILVHFWHLTFRSHSVDVDHVRQETVEHLGTSCSSISADIREISVGSNSLAE
mgnify:CR=1 FL=1